MSVKTDKQLYDNLCVKYDMMVQTLSEKQVEMAAANKRAEVAAAVADRMERLILIIARSDGY